MPSPSAQGKAKFNRSRTLSILPATMKPPYGPTSPKPFPTCPRSPPRTSDVCQSLKTPIPRPRSARSKSCSRIWSRACEMLRRADIDHRHCTCRSTCRVNSEARDESGCFRFSLPSVASKKAWTAFRLKNCQRRPPDVKQPLVVADSQDPGLGGFAEAESLIGGQPSVRQHASSKHELLMRITLMVWQPRILYLLPL